MDKRLVSCDPIRAFCPILLLSAIPLLAKDQEGLQPDVRRTPSRCPAKRTPIPLLLNSYSDTILGGHYIVVQLTVTPKGDKPLNVQLDDFQLFCEGDGDRTQPQSAAEIAAADSLVLKRGQSGIGSLGEETGTNWSGVGFGGRSGEKKKDDTPASAKIEKGKKDEGLKTALTEKSCRKRRPPNRFLGCSIFRWRRRS